MLQAFQIVTGSDAGFSSGSIAGIQLSQFTKYDGGANVHFLVSKSYGTIDGDSTVTVAYQLQPTDQIQR